MPVIPEIINQHAEEAAFNWLMRNDAVSAPHYDLLDLAHLDDRVEAHIDGLRIAADSGWEICHEAMAMEEPGEIFTAGVLAFESLIPERMDTMLGAVESDDELKRALVSAFGWIEFNHISGPMQRLLSADLAFLRYLGLGAHAIHRRDPGVVLVQLMESPDPLVRGRALKAAGELGRVDLVPAVRAHLQDQEEKCRFYAAWSAMLLGDSAGMTHLEKLAVEPGTCSQRACDLVMRKTQPFNAMPWLTQLAQQPELLRSAMQGYGALGDPAALPMLLEMMEAPETARPAGEAFSMITGVDIAYEDLEGEAPEGFEAGPTENPEDEDVALDPDEDLPWPDLELIERWWGDHRKQFQAGKRYLCGKLVSPEQCGYVLKHSYQRQRAAAALELVLMKTGQPLFELRAPGFLQQRVLGNQ